MASRLEAVALASAVVAAGAVYVMVHEARRKRKKAEKVAREAPISKEMLLTILSKSAEASKAVVERVRRKSRAHAFARALFALGRGRTDPVFRRPRPPELLPRPASSPAPPPPIPPAAPGGGQEDPGGAQAQRRAGDPALHAKL